MTGPAIDAGLIVPMTVQTPSHPQAERAGDAFHGRHFAMTGATVNLGAQMHHVREIDMIGQIVDPDPEDRLLLFPVGQQLLDFRSVGRDKEMTGAAIRHRRDTGQR